MLIKTWEELSKIPNESKTHILEVNLEEGNAWLRSKDKKPYKDRLSFMRQIKHQDVYLSTHAFYGHNYRYSTKILKACGFDVELDNWDKESVCDIGLKTYDDEWCDKCMKHGCAHIEPLSYSYRNSSKPDCFIEIEMVQYQGTYIPADLCIFNDDGEVIGTKCCVSSCSQDQTDCNSCIVTKVFNEYARLTRQPR